MLHGYTHISTSRGCVTWKGWVSEWIGSTWLGFSDVEPCLAIGIPTVNQVSNLRLLNSLVTCKVKKYLALAGLGALATAAAKARSNKAGATIVDALIRYKGFPNVCRVTVTSRSDRSRQRARRTKIAGFTAFITSSVSLSYFSCN